MAGLDTRGLEFMVEQQQHSDVEKLKYILEDLLAGSYIILNDL